jgi:anaerobic ribonucleoside-triphosphate reductase
MPLAPNTINRIFNNITQETSELSREDYIEVLEELKEYVEERLDAAQEDESREVRIKLELDESEANDDN